MTWLNQPHSIEDYHGFVYIITELDTGMKYIGKKNFWNKIRRKPLKGQKRVRLDMTESDWATYNSSNKEIVEKIKNNPANYEKEIIKLCKSKQDMAIWETYMQLDAYLHKDWNKYYNEVINLRLRVRKNEQN